jgi:hypothetical protein
MSPLLRESPTTAVPTHRARRPLGGLGLFWLSMACHPLLLSENQPLSKTWCGECEAVEQVQFEPKPKEKIAPKVVFAMAVTRRSNLAFELYS